ncbi:hypothetical protein RFI_07689 [Reticulomyxa filosa]|uniref:Uncharacterized protein n=1 Tax=Reticulomyxa filosa TaxID=46433 RepID=X6NUH3_RETFI|nr:hypothetical protein RFI_07689 [Reticulomyxa filosa]|eukprot:ETO29429.1 hypothetical protein RFI_07689 [Reticulomyxa filosa]
MFVCFFWSEFHFFFVLLMQTSPFFFCGTSTSIWSNENWIRGTDEDATCEVQSGATILAKNLTVYSTCLDAAMAVQQCYAVKNGMFSSYLDDLGFDYSDIHTIQCIKHPCKPNVVRFTNSIDTREDAPDMYLLFNEFSQEELRWQYQSRHQRMNNNFKAILCPKHNGKHITKHTTKQQFIECSHWLYVQLNDQKLQTVRLLGQNIAAFTSWPPRECQQVLLTLGSKIDELRFFFFVCFFQVCEKEIFFFFLCWDEFVDVMLSRAIFQDSNSNPNDWYLQLEWKRKTEKLEIEPLNKVMEFHYNSAIVTAMEHRQVAIGSNVQGSEASAPPKDWPTCVKVYDSCNALRQDDHNTRVRFYCGCSDAGNEESDDVTNIKNELIDDASWEQEAYVLRSYLRSSFSSSSTSRSKLGRCNDNTIPEAPFQASISLVERNLSGIYARQVMLQLLDDYTCIAETQDGKPIPSLRNLAPSICLSSYFFNHQLHNSVAPNCSGAKFIKFLESVFRNEKSSRVYKLERCLEVELLNEIARSADEHSLKLTSHEHIAYKYPLVYNLSKVVVRDFLTYVIDHNNLSTRTLKSITHLEFALWIVQIFTHLLVKFYILLDFILFISIKRALQVLFFNETSMNLLMQIVILTPSHFSSKLALLMSDIISQFPKKSKLHQLRDEIIGTKEYLLHPNIKEVNPENSDQMLHLSVRYINVVAGVVSQLHRTHFLEGQEYQYADTFLALVHLMVTIVLCNYHDNSEASLFQEAWFSQMTQAGRLLMWFNLSPSDQTTTNLQLLAPDTYMKMYDSLNKWAYFAERNKNVPEDINLIHKSERRHTMSKVQASINEVIEAVRSIRYLMKNKDQVWTESMTTMAENILGLSKMLDDGILSQYAENICNWSKQVAKDANEYGQASVGCNKSN